MDRTNEMFIASKFKYLKTTISKNLNVNTPSVVGAMNEKFTNKVKPDKNMSKEEKEKLAEEKRKQKEEKAKKMAELCKPSEKTQQKKVFTEEKKFINTTPYGKKKDLREPMPDKYDPMFVESAWDAWWSETKLFEVTLEKAKTYPKDKIFTMLLPPPNVTGSLHLGHTLMGAIEDSLTRWKRMKGYCALWVPGTDHAGISCQSVVEKKILKEEGKYRRDFSREDFLKKVWEWKHEYGNRIFEQFRKLGVSFDWSRMYFTMDDARSKSVQEAFIRLFENGTLYRARRMVHWCCSLKTAISDVEIEEVEVNEPKKLKIPGYKDEVEFGVLIDFAYKLKSDPSKEIVVSTTRIETMLGDVAVAVHSQDPRYKDFHGQKLIHPFFPDRDVTVITDDILVDMKFGTGAVKITPAHDPNDFECGQRNKLPMINILDDEGIINEFGGIFKGQKRYECRVKILDELKKLGLFRDKKPNKMILQSCSKTGDIIEPLIKPQWWINCKEVAQKGLEDVENGTLKIVPEFHKQTWQNFLGNIREWCVSRQLWWGHRCPAYLVKVEGKLDLPETDNNDHWVAAKSEEEAIEKAAKKYGICDKSKISVSQDEDVLDTWFSSALLPLSLFGWPDTKNEEFQLFYPSNVLETGHDIIFFWVARMVFFSYFFEGKVPYDTVYLHPIVKDAQGRKMSKSLGNVIDPLEVINGISLNEMIEQLKKGNLPEKEFQRSEKEKKKEYPQGIPACGADALRIGLMSYMIQGRNINLNIDRVLGYRGFGNKIWNAVNFFMKFGIAGTNFKPDLKQVNPNNSKLTFIDRWILNKLSKITLNFDKSFENYDFGSAVEGIYQFWKSQLCDVYIEAIKPIFKSSDEEQKELTRNILYYILDNALRILHPITPFVTEELYQRLHFDVLIKTDPNADPEGIKSICIAEFPTDISFIDEEIEKLGKLVEDIAHSILGISKQFTAKQKEKKPKHQIIFLSENKYIQDFISKESLLISTLSKVQSISTVSSIKELNESQNLRVMYDDSTDYFINLTEFNLDNKLESKRLESELNDRDKLRKDLVEKMSVKDYETKVNEQIKTSNKEKIEKIEKEISKLQENLKKIIN